MPRSIRSLFSVLHLVVDELQISVLGVTNLNEKLSSVRKNLLGETDDDITSDRETAKVLEAIIVIEEFCKELAAIAFVKHHTML